MKITDALLGEHAMLYALFTQIGTQITEERTIEQLQASIEILENQLWTHAQIEEKYLFPALEPHFGEMGPLAVMKAEHREIEDYLETAKSEEDVTQLKSHIMGLIDLSYGHFQKEEMVLFAMAKQFLSGVEQESLGDAWADERAVLIEGKGCPSMAAAG